jgi:hypothetical protein
MESNHEIRVQFHYQEQHMGVNEFATKEKSFVKQMGVQN